MINLISPINTLGYGVAGYNILKELYKLDDSITLYPIGQPEDVDTTGIVSRAIQNQSTPIVNRPCVKIWHQHELQRHIGKGSHIGFPIFELTEFNATEISSLHHCDKIFVCSEWAKNIILENTTFAGDAVHVVPLGVDTDIFNPDASKSRSNTIFFNCGKWEKRKGHDVILECFNEAFDYNDNVELWMMCDNPFIGDQNQEWQKLYKTSPLGGKIKVIPRQVRHEDVYNIMSQTDCGVFPARAEGWNLELLEMMACGKHVIATNYSAHTQFCSPSNCRLIEIDNLETAYDGVFFLGDKGLWAELASSQKDQVITHMKDIHRAKQTGELPINNAGVDTATKFSWENSAKGVCNGLV